MIRHPNGRETSPTVVSAAFAVHLHDRSASLATVRADSGHASTDSQEARAALLARLASELAQLAAAGDVEGARVLLDTIARLTQP